MLRRPRWRAMGEGSNLIAARRLALQAGRSSLWGNEATAPSVRPKATSIAPCDLRLALAFYQSPELLTGAQRLIQRGIEFVGDNIPAPWGPRIEFVFREVGGLLWLQIILLVLALRIVLSTLAIIFRSVRRPY